MTGTQGFTKVSELKYRICNQGPSICTGWEVTPMDGANGSRLICLKRIRIHYFHLFISGTPKAICAVSGRGRSDRRSGLLPTLLLYSMQETWSTGDTATGNGVIYTRVGILSTG